MTECVVWDGVLTFWICVWGIFGGLGIFYFCETLRGEHDNCGD